MYICMYWLHKCIHVGISTGRAYYIILYCISNPNENCKNGSKFNETCYIFVILHSLYSLNFIAKRPLGGHSGRVGDSGNAGIAGISTGRFISAASEAISSGLVLMKIGPLPGRTNSTVRSVVLVLVLDVDIMVALKSSVLGSCFMVFRHHHHFKQKSTQQFSPKIPCFPIAMSQQPHTQRCWERQ